MKIGRIVEIWRYPVKSMGGEQLQGAALGALGLHGDRGWAIRDEAIGEIRSAKRVPDLMKCDARYLEEPAEDRIPAAQITIPGAAPLRTDSADGPAALSKYLGRPVTIWPRQPRESKEFYRRKEDISPIMRSVFGRLEDEPLPDLTALGPELLGELIEYVAPLGTYFDAFPIHAVTTTSLQTLEKNTPGSRFDVRRFRPNFLIQLDAPGSGELPENQWCGKTLKIGTSSLQVVIPCMRCVMTTLPTGDLPKDPRVLRTIVKDGAQNLGVYAKVAHAGPVRVGDSVELV